MTGLDDQKRIGHQLGPILIVGVRMGSWFRSGTQKRAVFPKADSIKGMPSFSPFVFEWPGLIISQSGTYGHSNSTRLLGVTIVTEEARRKAEEQRTRLDTLVSCSLLR